MSKRKLMLVLSLLFFASIIITYMLYISTSKYERTINEYVAKNGYIVELNPFPHFETCEAQHKSLSYLDFSNISLAGHRFENKYRKQTVTPKTQNSLPSRGILLSYPRSGNHLVRTILHCLLDSPTYGYAREEPIHRIEMQRKNQTYISPGLYRQFYATSAHPFVLKRHSYKHISELHKTMLEEFIIYVVRDPLETVISHLKTKYWLFRTFDAEVHTIINNTRVYLSWFNKHKYLLYYEDIVSKDAELAYQSLYNLSVFLNVSLTVCNRCYQAMNDITTLGLKSLKRKPSSGSNEHYYRDKYSYLSLYVNFPKDVYPVFDRYENSRGC